jgi:hypothetical protein
VIEPTALRKPGIDLLREVVDHRLLGLSANEIVAELGVCRNDVLLVVQQLCRLEGRQISSRGPGRPKNRYSDREAGS